MTTSANIPTHDKKGNLRAIIETPRGSNVKIRFDEEVEMFELCRPLSLGIVYLFDWGFIPSTRAPDGDPLDVLVYHDSTSYPGVIIPCRPIGVVKLTQKTDRKGKERNDRIIALPANDPRHENVEELPERIRKELEQFFLSAVFFEDKGVKIEGWGGPKEAEKLVRAAQKAYDAGGEE